MDTTNAILIIGAGQIGSRHLQALAQLDANYEITVFDVSEQGLALSKERLLEVESNGAIIHFTTRHPDNCKFDLAIIATGAATRLSALKALTDNNEVKSIVFEKVLFQSVAQIQNAKHILRQKEIAAWVNCPRRMMPCYREIRDKLKATSPINVTIQGADFGLACNAIHFLDLFAYLSADVGTMSIEGTFNSTPVPAKRQGCYEVFGKIEARSGPHVFSMTCDEVDGIEEIAVTVACDDIQITIDEINSTMVETTSSDNRVVNSDCRLPFQSEMSQHFAESIIAFGKCELPTFNESAQLHEVMLPLFSDFFTAHGVQELDECPIS